MFIRSKAPLRLGFAGGGTDVSPFSDTYGGTVLNATINLFAHVTIEPLPGNQATFRSIDHGSFGTHPLMLEGNPPPGCSLAEGVYRRFLKDFGAPPSGFNLTTFVDAPAGSGLGTSSTLTVALVAAFADFFGVALGEYDIAQLAFQIERIDLALAGGKQDQYAAAFGGFNFMEFGPGQNVVVNPLRLKKEIISELESSLVLYFTGMSRASARIIEAQSRNVSSDQHKGLEAMIQLKEQSTRMKEAVLKGQLGTFGEILNYGWKLKKETAAEVTSPVIDEIFRAAEDAGSTGGKISGAGGGGFIMFFCPGVNRYPVIDALGKFGGEFRRFQFVKHGVITWRTH
ncbi:GHMP family kinase ATP-binding protein [Mesoterricola sediminis]|uniref:Dehydrogenase n=1 Tax=Mesoterricola sediminis TaxID=2927980 RepID=A0AA48GTD0_9BACT|nr:GHMP kinase [Mesoterricola sediminis]BDU75295.1 dehydrogenase [Mesoterricola sediminis]